MRGAAFVLGLFGLICTGVAVLAQANGVSPLLTLPAVAVAGVVSPSRRMRAVAAAAKSLWCALTAASVGLLLAPCAAAMIVAARRTA